MGLAETNILVQAKKGQGETNQRLEALLAEQRQTNALIAQTNTLLGQLVAVLSQPARMPQQPMQPQPVRSAPPGPWAQQQPTSHPRH